jgi:predicted  nucleic acid-binding Zn-ribbon protein
MLDTIEKLLVLQDRDKHITRIKAELAQIEPQRQVMLSRAASAQSGLDNARQRIKSLEARRKELELEVETRKQQIERYSNQQLQTRKNEEYRALAHEIDTCKDAIFKIEDQELELMEQAEATQKEVAAATRGASDAKNLADDQLAQLATREQHLRQELAALEASREELVSAVDVGARARYERLVRSKGENVVVGVAHGVCGGCHMRLPAQILVTCQAQNELVACTNCGRILYYTRDMDLAAAE